MEGQRVVAVVGAGIAGLAAARELGERGLSVLVFEREDRPGGRVGCEIVEGFTLETGCELLSSADRDVLAWIDALGLRDDLLPLRPAIEAHAHRGRVRDTDPRDLLGVARIPGVRPHQAQRLLRLPRLLDRYAARLHPSAPERAAPLDDRSLADFARLYFGRSVLEHWIGPFATGASLGDPEQTSRVRFLGRYRTHGRARAGLARAPLGELPVAAAKSLRLRFGANVERVEPQPEGKLLVVALDGGRQRALEVDAAVIAAAAPDAVRVAERVLTWTERQGLESVGYAPSLTLFVALRRAFSPHPRLVTFPCIRGQGLATALFEPGVPGGRVPDGRGLLTLRATAAWSRAYFDAPDETVEKEFLDAFAACDPSIRGAPLFTKLVRVKRAHPRFDVGRYREIARFEHVQSEQRRLGRRLYFAGDYLTDPSWSGALASARRVADAVAADLT